MRCATPSPSLGRSAPRRQRWLRDAASTDPSSAAEDDHADESANHRADESAGSLADVLPGVAAALGVTVSSQNRLDRLDRLGALGRLLLPPARQVVVVLVDGLGELLLARRDGHAPFLRNLRRNPGEAVVEVVSSGFPSTTATSMGMIGTGLHPGGHGLVGLDVLDPARGVVFSELAWDPAVEPRTWQPVPTVFEEVAAAGVEVVRIGPKYFDGSGLTEAALRGGRFVAGATLQARVDAAVTALAGSAALGSPCLIYLYWGELDKTGHVHGCDSWQWGEELSSTDAHLARLVERVGPQTLVVITADHGMVDVPFHHRVDVAHEPDLAAGVRFVGGEPRGLHLYCEPGAAHDVLATWRARVGDRIELHTREDAVRAGWFGPVEPWVLPRIGDVVGSATGPYAVVDSRTARPESLRLIGLHGARTRAEQLVPLIATSGTARR